MKDKRSLIVFFLLKSKWHSYLAVSHLIRHTLPLLTFTAESWLLSSVQPHIVADYRSICQYSRVALTIRAYCFTAPLDRAPDVIKQPLISQTADNDRYGKKKDSSGVTSVQWGPLISTTLRLIWLYDRYTRYGAARVTNRTDLHILIFLSDQCELIPFRYFCLSKLLIPPPPPFPQV